MKASQKGGLLIILSVIIIIAFVAGGAYYLGTKKTKVDNASLKDLNRTTDPSPTATPSMINPSNSAIVFNIPPVAAYNDEVISPDGKYSFVLDSNDDGLEKCSYSLTERSSNRKFLLKSIGDKIPCLPGPGYVSAFLALGSNDRLAVGQELGKIAIVNILTDTYATHSYHQNLSFTAVNKDLDIWVFNKPAGSPSIGTPVTFVVNDKNNKTLKELNFGRDDQKEYALFRVLSDTTNDGFIFITRKYQTLPRPTKTSDYEVSYKFDLLSASDLSFKTILTTDYLNIPGRGCSGDSLASVKGEAIIKPGCIMVSDKYLSPDKSIHIKL